jgi:nitroimidazol reductase NimA-like FMN-containing flavoprotein (pyridoxamine 5'-phosphate oxidase superfamily)
MFQTLKVILDDQRLAVLSTRDGNQPYCNLVCFAATDNLRSLVFATPRATRKYANLSAEFRVAMLVDDRANEAADTDKATAVTAIGMARELSGQEKVDLLSRYIDKHPQLKRFASSSDTALFRIEVDRYIVSRFQHTQVISMRGQK